MLAALVVGSLAIARVAAAEPALARSVATMQLIDDPICTILRSDKRDRCARIARTSGAAVFQAGSKRGIRRVVLAIDHDGEQLISAGSDYLGEDCTAGTCVSLTALKPTVRAIAIDGQPGVVLELTASFRGRTTKDAWQTEAIVGCGPSASGTWKCVTVDTARCAATVAGDGAVTTSCGGHTMLSLR